MTVASIHQNSFAMNVEWSVKIFLKHMHFFLFSIQNFTILKKTIRIVSSDP